MPPRKKLTPPAARLQGLSGIHWADAFIEYLRTESHMSDNTVAAYRRDLRRFRQWLGERAVGRVVDQEVDILGEPGRAVGDQGKHAKKNVACPGVVEPATQADEVVRLRRSRVRRIVSIIHSSASSKLEER